MYDMSYIISRTLENKIAIAEHNNQNTLLVTLDVLKEILDLLKEQEGYVSIPFSWLVKFCTHIDFKEPMSDQERELLWRRKLDQQFGIGTISMKQIVLCKNCKTEIRPGDKYCRECGSKISSL